MPARDATPLPIGLLVPVLVLMLVPTLLPMRVLAAEPTASLNVDPFARPAPAPREPLAGVSDAPVLPPWQGRLLMTLRAGEDSLVNVDGQIVALGERYRGFELVGVGERTARFVRAGEEIDVSLDDPVAPLGFAETEVPNHVSPY